MLTTKDRKDISCFMGTENPILKSVINRLQYGTPYNPAETRVNRVLPVPLWEHSTLRLIRWYINTVQLGKKQ